MVPGGTAPGGSFLDLSHAGPGGYVEYDILLNSLEIGGNTSIGLRWGMTCANDGVEESVSVPETGALMLLGPGLRARD